KGPPAGRSGPPGCGKDRPPPRRLRLARQPPHVRLTPSNVRGGPPDTQRAWWLEDSGNGAAVRPPRAQPPPSSGGAAGADAPRPARSSPQLARSFETTAAPGALAQGPST